jgi:SAM-dependent methyltransferase
VQPLVKRDLRAAKYLDLRRARGAVSALRRLGSDLLFHAAFYRPLGRAAGLPLRHPGVQLARMDATRCGFADASFDVVYSSACFEHLPDVPGAVAEIDRVLKPNGLAEIEIHLFSSMTGGHESELHDHRVPPAGFPLWGHLLDPEWQPPLFLNRWTDRQFRDAFAARFEILDRQVTSRHGEQYVTREIEARLAPRYTPDQLTTESVLYMLRKR